MVKIQCGTCQAILLLHDYKPEKLYICECCETLIRAPNAVETGVVIKDFIVLKKLLDFNNETDIFTAHQISLDRLVCLELFKSRIHFSPAEFFKTSQFFARLNHKSISTIFDIGQEKDNIFRSYEHNDGIFIKNLWQKKVSHNIAINIFFDYLDFIFYFLRIQTGEYYNLLADRAIVTPEYRLKIIPSVFRLSSSLKCNFMILQNVTKLFLGMVTHSNSCKEFESLSTVHEKLKQFVFMNINMSDAMMYDIVKHKEKCYFSLYDELREEVLNLNL